MNYKTAKEILESSIKVTKNEISYYNAVEFLFRKMQNDQFAKTGKIYMEEPHKFIRYAVRYAIQNKMSEYIIEQIKLHCGWYNMQKGRAKQKSKKA